MSTNGGRVIRIRTCTSRTLSDMLWTGEIVFNTTDDELGFNTGQFALWYPQVDAINNLFVADVGGIQGKAPDGNLSMLFDFSVPDMLSILTPTGISVGSLSTGGISFTLSAYQPINNAGHTFIWEPTVQPVVTQRGTSNDITVWNSLPLGDTMVAGANLSVSLGALAAASYRNYVPDINFSEVYELTTPFATYGHNLKFGSNSSAQSAPFVLRLDSPENSTLNQISVYSFIDDRALLDTNFYVYAKVFGLWEGTTVNPISQINGGVSIECPSTGTKYELPFVAEVLGAAGTNTVSGKAYTSYAIKYDTSMFTEAERDAGIFINWIDTGYILFNATFNPATTQPMVALVDMGIIPEDGMPLDAWGEPAPENVFITYQKTTPPNLYEANRLVRLRDGDPAYVSFPIRMPSKKYSVLAESSNGSTITGVSISDKTTKGFLVSATEAYTGEKYASVSVGFLKSNF